MKRKKSLIFSVTIASLFIHGIGLYLLCHLSLTQQLGFQRNPFSLSLLDQFIDEKIEEVALPQSEEKQQESAFAQQECAGKEEPLLLPTQLASAIKLKVTPTPQKILDSSDSDSEFPEIELGVSELMNNQEIFIAPAVLPPLKEGITALPDNEKFCEADNFSYQVEYAPRHLRTGYVFKITLNAKQEVPFKQMRQNFSFLLDRSNSIPRGRYLLNKKAVMSAISTLSAEDRFNILIFDDRIVRLSTEPIFATAENIAKAKEFLENQGHGGFFTTTNIYATLGKILPKLIAEKEVNTTILLSDGDTYLSTENQRQLIRTFNEANNGKVSLYTFASGTGNNLSLLETISSFNKGALLYVQDFRQIEEKLTQLVLSLSHPLGKEVVATAIGLNKENAIYLQPKNGRLSDLYKTRPFTIYGTTNRLSDFTLFIQGKYYDRQFDIKKRISFKEARAGTLDLERRFTTLLVQDYLEQYFKDGKLSHLESANQLLNPLNIDLPFAH